MSMFGKIFDGIEHAAKPLLSAAAKWAENDGLKIVREVETEVKAKAPGELLALFNSSIGAKLGVTLPAGTALTSDASDLLMTELARVKAQATSGATLRSAVLNAGVEQALLLFKGAMGDTATAPTPTVSPPAVLQPVRA